MPTFQVEMLWRCFQCGYDPNRGLAKHCGNCGHPKGMMDAEYMPDAEDMAHLDGLKKQKAKAGPDWKCFYCGSLQSQLNHCCDDCGSPKRDGISQTQYSASTRGLPEASEEGSGTATPAPQSAIPTDLSAVDSTAKKKWRDSIPTIIISILIIPLGFLLWWLFHTRTVDATVVDLSWKQEITIQRFQIWHREGWDSESGAFNIKDDGRRVHHYEHVRVGSHPETYMEQEQCGEDCHTISGSCFTTPVNCSPNGNGTATCSGGDRVCSPDTVSCTPRYCTVQRTRTVDDYEEQPNYQEWYEWDVWDWGFNRAVSRSGTTTETTWPDEVELRPTHLREGEKEREGGRKGTYGVVFANEKEKWVTHPDTEEEFRLYPINTRWRLKVGVAHGVEVVSRAP